MKYGEKLGRLVGRRGDGMWSNVMPIYWFKINATGKAVIVEVGDDYIIIEERFKKEFVPLSRFSLTQTK